MSCGNNGMMNGYIIKYVRGHYRDEDEEEQIIQLKSIGDEIVKVHLDTVYAMFIRKM